MSRQQKEQQDVVDIVHLPDSNVEEESVSRYDRKRKPLQKLDL